MVDSPSKEEMKGVGGGREAFSRVEGECRLL